MNKSTLALVIISTLAMAAGLPAHAAIDVTAATTAITTDGGGAISAIGQAMLGLAAIAVVFKWAKASIFG